MLNAPKPAASLNPSLLARKGAARPAMRPQLQGSQFVSPVMQEVGVETDDDLGWNDMGHEAEEAGVESPVPEVIRQQQAIAREMASPPTVTAKPATSGRRAAFTLRLDADRHLRLRLASAVSHRSAQQVVTEALDQFLAGFRDLDALTNKLQTQTSDK